MQRFVLTLVLVCNVFVGIEASSDVEDVLLELGFTDILSSVSHDHSHDSEGDGIDGDHCDHCCHAGAHLIAFANAPAGLEMSLTDLPLGIGVQLHGRAGRSPPLPPPIV